MSVGVDNLQRAKKTINPYKTITVSPPIDMTRHCPHADLNAGLSLRTCSRDLMNDLSSLGNKLVRQSQLFGSPKVVRDDSSRSSHPGSSSLESVISFTLESEFVPD